MKKGKSFCCGSMIKGVMLVGTTGSTDCMQGAVLVVGRLPKIKGALPDEIEESVGNAATREDLDLPEFDANPLCLHTLLSHPYLDGLTMKKGRKM